MSAGSRSRRTLPARPRKVRDQRRRGVEHLEPESQVELHDVPARREVREVIALLAEQRPYQAHTVMSVRLEHAPGREVADLLRSSVDRALRVEGEVRPNDSLALLEQEAVVRLVELPRRRHRLRPGLAADADVEIDARGTRRRVPRPRRGSGEGKPKCLRTRRYGTPRFVGDGRRPGRDLHRRRRRARRTARPRVLG